MVGGLPVQQRFAPIHEHKVIQFNKSKVWERNPGVYTNSGRRQETTGGEKDRRKVGGGRRVSDREGKGVK